MSGKSKEAAWDRSRLLCASAGMAGCICFVALAAAVVLQRGDLVAIDGAVSTWLASHRTTAFTDVMIVVTQLHSTAGIHAMAVAACAVLLHRQRDWRTAGWLAVSVSSSSLLNVGLKHVFIRARPADETALLHLTSFSFPSGHALASTVWWGCVSYLFATIGRGAPAVAVAVTMVAATCLSRVYLGVHYPSDVAAGVCEGVVCVSFWVFIARRHRDRIGLWSSLARPGHS